MLRHGSAQSSRKAFSVYDSHSVVKTNSSFKSNCDAINTTWCVAKMLIEFSGSSKTSFLFCESHCFNAAVPLFGCWAKFATLSVSAGRTILCIENTKQKSTRITLVTFVHCIFSVLGYMLAMWLLQGLLLLHNSCNIWFHAWCCYTLIASTICKNPVYLTNHWLDSRDVVETQTSRLRPG